jgi:two-component system response regulator
MTGRTILLVEDNADDELLTIRALQRNNLLNEVTVARDGAEALGLLFDGEEEELTRPGLILLDLKLPKIDGLEVLRRIRTDPRTRHIPVVILTASHEQEDVVAGYEGGANAYVRKPVRFSDFSDAVKAVGMFWLLVNEPAPGPGRTDEARRGPAGEPAPPDEDRA